jgi:hypothetical protein
MTNNTEQLSLKEIFYRHNGRGTGKWSHYFEVYERYFSRYRDKEVHILEIGISGGGSLQIWKEYFGKNAHIYGVDTAYKCKEFEEDQIQIFIGDQSNKRFLRSLIEELPKIDIVLDDGGHMPHQQINSFDILFPFVEDDGVYMCEDTHTSYINSFYKGSYDAKNTFISCMKRQIDYLHAWHTDDKDKLKVSDFTKSAFCISFYNSIVAIEKRVVKEPEQTQSGNTWLPVKPNRKDFIKRAFNKIKVTLGV